MSRLIGSDGGAFTIDIASAVATQWDAGEWYQIDAPGDDGTITTEGSGGARSYSGDLGRGDLVYIRSNSPRSTVAISPNPTTTTFTLANAGDLAVGDNITIDGETRPVTALSTNAVTVAPAFGSAPTAGDVATWFDPDDDDLKAVTFSRVESISSWSFNLQRPEIDLTTLEDEDRVYRFGRSEWQGEVAGVFDRDVTHLYSRVVRSIEFVSGTTAPTGNEDTVTAIASSEFPFVGVLDVGNVDGVTFVFVERVSLGGYGFGATDGQRQEFTAPIRRADGPFSLSPTMYHVPNVLIPGA